MLVLLFLRFSCAEAQSLPCKDCSSLIGTPRAPRLCVSVSRCAKRRDQDCPWTEQHAPKRSGKKKLPVISSTPLKSPPLPRTGRLLACRQKNFLAPTTPNGNSAIAKPCCT